MRSPSIVPDGFDVDVYVVLDDFGELGRAYREVDETKADKETLIRDLMAGQYEHPIRIVAFNTAAGWSRDVTESVVRELLERAQKSGAELPIGLRNFVEYELDRVKRREALVR
jgi:hypothetical protein